MIEDRTIRQCPKCGKQIEYYELECDEPFTAPAELRFKALTIWGVAMAAKEIVCRKNGFVHFRFVSDGSERLVRMMGFDREKFQDKLAQVSSTRKPCEQEGCEEQGYPCLTMWEPTDPIGYFCEDHMRENGVCPGCHEFLAGTEGFDFSRSGYCESCEEEIEQEMGYCDEDEPDDLYYESGYDEVNSYNLE